VFSNKAMEHNYTSLRRHGEILIFFRYVLIPKPKKTVFFIMQSV